jgi:hypothetical protein
MKTNIIISCFLLNCYLIFSQPQYSGQYAPPVIENEELPSFFRNGFQIMVVSDWGRNGYFNQAEVANAMAATAVSVNPKFIVSCGDNFQINGVQSVSDPLWITSFESIYRHPSLLVDWFPVLGNHDYRGSTQAELDYSKISRRWRMNEHYYTFARKINDSISARFIFLDTPPFVNEYRNKASEYPDIMIQDTTVQLAWLRRTLASAHENWILVFGHHPVYAAGNVNCKDVSDVLKPIFEKYNPDFYICGHVHNFQHLKPAGEKIDYVITGTGSELVPAEKNESTLFDISDSGFSLISFFGNKLKFSFVNKEGKVLYQFENQK